MSIVNTTDLAIFIKLKLQQIKIETYLQSLKDNIQKYETKLEDYLEEHPSLDINNSFKIFLQKNAPYEPLTFKYLEKCLNDLYPNNNNIVQKILQYVRSNRTRIYKQKVIFETLKIKDK